MDASTPPRLVVVALDTSSGSSEALRWALGNVLRAGRDRALLLTVMPSSVPVSGQPGFHVAASEVHGDTAQKKKDGVALLQKYVAMCQERNVPTDVRVMIGDARLAICEAANEAKASALVVGSRGHGPLRRLVLGSISEYCVKHCECPVIVVRPNTHGHSEAPAAS